MKKSFEAFRMRPAVTMMKSSHAPEPTTGRSRLVAPLGLASTFVAAFASTFAAALAFSAVLCVPTVANAQTQAQPQPVAAPASQDPQVLRGAYLAKAGDCVACHTVDRKKPFAGGAPLATNFGTIYSTNITPDPTHGIGQYSYEDFAKALRQGVAKDGHYLYPAMPYPSYAKINDADMQALYSYFMHGVAPIPQTNLASNLSFPFNIRALMVGWNLMFLPKQGAFQPDPQQSVEWNRGAYLVQGLEHCGACHTARGAAGQEKALDGHDDAYLGGYTLAGWYAPSLRGPQSDGLRGWSQADLSAYLRSGRTEDGAAFGPMAEVIEHSTQFLSDSDLNAIGTYLISVKTAGNASSNSNNAAVPIKTNGSVDTDPTAVAFRGGHINSSGAELYLNNCNACHRSNGNGAVPTFPTLGHNAVVVSSDPSSLIHIVLSGSHMPSTEKAPTPLAMPDFGWRLSDQQVADLLSFVRSSWGNQASAVTADQVAKVRKASAEMK
jgi:mono/diheme cytochrome c family protein